jgi:predicted dehydrogenase
MATGVAVAGFGVIGRVHAENLACGIGDTRLAMVVDPSRAALRAAARRFGVPTSTSYEAALSSDGVQAVVIASPPGAHAEMVTSAAEAGKHVLCEKPLSLDVETAVQAVAAARRAGVALQVGFHRRFDRDYEIARARVRSGALGRIYSYAASMRDMEPPSRVDVGDGYQALVHDSACHDLDAARWLIGEIEEITAQGATLASPTLRGLGQVDHTVMLIRFANGALGTLDHSFACGYGFDCRAEVVGSLGTLRVDAPYISGVELLGRAGGGFERTRTFLDRFHEAYRRELVAFGQAIRNESSPVVTGEDGLAAVTLATAAQRSLELGQTVRLRRRRVEGGMRYAI